MRNKQTVIYAVIFLMQVVLTKVEFMDVSPLNVGLLVACFPLGLNVPIVGAFTVAAAFIDFSWLNVIYKLFAVAVVVGMWLLSMRKKLNVNMYVLCAMGCQLSLIFAGILFGMDWVAIVIGCFFSLLSAALFYGIGVPIICNGLRYRLLDSEAIAGGIVIACLGCGLANLTEIPLVPFVFSIVVLAGCFIKGTGGVIAGVCLGIGYCAVNGVELMGAFLLMGLTALIFIPAPRILSAASLPMSFILYTFFFNVLPDDWIAWIISLALGGVVYILVPRRNLERVRAFFAPSKRAALRGMVNRQRVDMAKRLDAVSGVFGEMSSIMLNEYKISDEHLERLTEALTGEVCSLCHRYNKCKESGTLESLSKVMSDSLDHGRVTIAELPSCVRENCMCLAQLISASAQLAGGYNERVTEIRNLNAAKQMVSSQLKGISDVLSVMAQRESKQLRYNEDEERKLAEELTYRGVITSEALVTGEDYPIHVMMTVLSECVNVEIIKNVLRRQFGMPFVLESVETSTLSGWSVIYACAKPKYDVIFSVCGCGKETVSGDTHSFVKIDSHRFLMAVCDGMGSGERAGNFSESTISLIESFYKAGFDHELVLKSVNDFLSLSDEEIYSAADVAVVDLENGLCDVIKIGSPPSYIKTSDSVLRIDGSALPIGVLEEMRPSVATYELSPGDTLVLTSDGVVMEGDRLADIINNADKYPEALCRTVVDATIADGKKDDVTVAAFHIFESV